MSLQQVQESTNTSSAYPLTSPDSSVVWLDENTRQGHIAGFMGMSVTPAALQRQIPGRIIFPASVHATYGAFLAWKHIKEKSGAVLSFLPERLRQCDMDFTYDSRDTIFLPHHAVRQLLEITVDRDTNQLNQTGEKQYQKPIAIIGGFGTDVSIQLALLGAGLEVPQVSSVTPTAFLDNSPFFARTFTTDAAHAHAALSYLNEIGVKHMVFLLVDGPCCVPYSAAVQQLEKEKGMVILRILYDKNNIEAAIQKVKDSGYRYVFLLNADYRPVMEVAFQYGIVGNSNYTWFLAERSRLASDEFALDRATEGDFAKSLNGVGLINFHTKYNAAFEEAMLEIATNKTLQNEFLSIQTEPDLLGAFNFSAAHSRHIYQKLTYDAVIAVALAACDTPGLFSGRELYDTLVKTEFEGVSAIGQLSFDHETGTRSGDTVQFIVQNVVLSDERSDEKSIRYEAKTVAYVQGGSVQVEQPFIFYDNTTNLPLQLPPIAGEELNYIPLGLQILGWALAGFVMSLSIFFMLWTYKARKSFVVRAAQPIFLYLVCIGCFIQSASVFPMSVQAKEPSRGADIACMCIPWLCVLGFTVSFSALSSKMWRISKLIGSGLRMQRAQLSPQDVMRPFFFLLIFNVAMLTFWTIFAPYRYRRIMVNTYDDFDRSIESYGICETEGVRAAYFWIPIVTANVLLVIVAIIQCYKARNFPLEFSETKYLTISFSSFLEALILGTPILFVAQNNPPAFFLVSSVLICILSLTMLLPIFAPKFLNRGAVQLQGSPNIVRRARSSGELGGTAVTNEQARQGSGSFRGPAPRRASSFQIDMRPPSGGLQSIAERTSGSAERSSISSWADELRIPGRMRITRR